MEGTHGGGAQTVPAAARGRSHRGTLRGGGERALAFFTRRQNRPGPIPFPVQGSREGGGQSGAQPRPHNGAKKRPERGCKSGLRPVSPVPSRAGSPFPNREQGSPRGPKSGIPAGKRLSPYPRVEPPCGAGTARDGGLRRGARPEPRAPVPLHRAAERREGSGERRGGRGAGRRPHAVPRQPCPLPTKAVPSAAALIRLE